LLKYLYILVILYNLNLLLNAFIQLMIKNVNIFNYKNTTKFSKNKFFYDLIINFYIYKNLFALSNLNVA
jgi:hypothetical protein